jgi:hypothetical protein|nr:MAG TPA: ECF sigma factor [Bacteriophage sp.]
MTKKELEDIMTKAVAAGIKKYREERKEEVRANKFHDTYILMKNYRSAKYHAQNAVSDSEQLANTALGHNEHLESVRHTRAQTMLMLAHIDTALAEMKRRRTQQGREIEYKAFEMYFVEGMDYEYIAEQLNTGKNTPRRWVSSIVDELGTLLWGYELERLG